MNTNTKLTFAKPTLLTATYNEDQVKYLILESMKFGVKLCIYVPIDKKNDIRKIEYIYLTPQNIRMVWQSKENIITIKATDENNYEIQLEVNIHGLMVDKIHADILINAASENIEPSNQLHISNVPSLTNLTKYNSPNKYNIKLIWREIGELKREIQEETTETRRSRIKERVANYMMQYAKFKPTKKQIIAIVFNQENTIREALGISRDQLPSLQTYQREERENRRSPTDETISF
jgi:hypothetical protein